MEKWYIKNKTEKDEDLGCYLFWNNKIGWTLLAHATGFTEDEKNSLRLPIDGEWVKE